jgi:hypothetical protein
MAEGIWQKQGKSYKKQEIRALRHFAVVHENESVPPILTPKRKDAINPRNFSSLRLRVKYQGVV